MSVASYMILLLVDWEWRSFFQEINNMYTDDWIIH